MRQLGLKPDSARALLAKIDAKIKQGVLQPEACAEFGISESAVGYWRRKLRDLKPRKRRAYKKRKHQIHVEAAPQAPQLVRIWGETNAKQMVLLSDLQAVA